MTSGVRQPAANDGSDLTIFPPPGSSTSTSRGIAAQVEAARELLDALDVPLDHVMMEVHLIRAPDDL